MISVGCLMLEIIVMSESISAIFTRTHQDSAQLQRSTAHQNFDRHSRSMCPQSSPTDSRPTQKRQGQQVVAIVVLDVSILQGAPCR